MNITEQARQAGWDHYKDHPGLSKIDQQVAARNASQGVAISSRNDYQIAWLEGYAAAENRENRQKNQ